MRMRPQSGESRGYEMITRLFRTSVRPSLTSKEQILQLHVVCEHILIFYFSLQLLVMMLQYDELYGYRMTIRLFGTSI